MSDCIIELCGLCLCSFLCLGSKGTCCTSTVHLMYVGLPPDTRWLTLCALLLCTLQVGRRGLRRFTGQPQQLRRGAVIDASQTPRLPLILEKGVTYALTEILLGRYHVGSICFSVSDRCKVE
ncbi:hypothetical protein GGR53DRAFT_456772 [Hypoxylon sp. FL1150]|nr:hypothetical protein GGR53DRAFT_456772 [Hypoxylon sp. FL1150]